MKSLSLFLLFLAIGTFSFAQESNKTLVKTLDPMECSEILFKFDHNNLIQEKWDNDQIRVELVVKANMPEQILTQLAKAKRYSITGTKNGLQFDVNAPNINKSVSIKGRELEEEISIVVKTPGFYVFNENTMAKDPGFFAARSADNAEAAKILAEQMKIKGNINFDIKFESTLKIGADAKIDLEPGDILIDGVPLEIE
jgi:hypothetical protein